MVGYVLTEAQVNGKVTKSDALAVDMGISQCSGRGSRKAFAVSTLSPESFLLSRLPCLYRDVLGKREKCIDFPSTQPLPLVPSSSSLKSTSSESSATFLSRKTVKNSNDCCIISILLREIFVRVYTFLKMMIMGKKRQWATRNYTNEKSYWKQKKAERKAHTLHFIYFLFSLPFQRF